MIQKAKETDLNFLLDITKACAQLMISNGIYQWNERYPTMEVFQDDLKREEFFVLNVNEIIIGCVTISEHMDDEYRNVAWLTPNGNQIYIHRLAVHPNYQNQGYAKRIMGFAEAIAKKKRVHSIRLDTFSKNFRNQKFYELCGYQKLGSIYFPKQSEHPFYCYELVF